AKVSGLSSSLDFGSLEKDTKMRKVYALKKIVNVMTSLIAPNDQSELMRLYLESLVPKAWMESSDTTLDKSPIVSTGLPYGERKVKTSDGTSLSIPNTIRLLQHVEDCALQLYKQKLEGIQTHNNVLAEVSEAMLDLRQGVDKSNEGWALKGKRKYVEYTKEAKAFAANLFHQGDGTGRKIDSAEVERLMKEQSNRTSV
ncbi:hypothetical protein PENTCL1PPCAC_14355, partial [Pristionchus entomophagus]